MLHAYELTVPANTPKTAPTTSLVTVSPGTLRQVSVSFPPGAANLCHVQVRYHEHQIIPANPDGDLAWDDWTFTWDEEVDLTEVPRELKLTGWNEDDTYPHTVKFHFDILPGLPAREAGILSRLARFLGA